MGEWETRGMLEMDSEFMGREDSRDWKVGRNCRDEIVLIELVKEM
jgi:hypothetical protein